MVFKHEGRLFRIMDPEYVMVCLIFLYGLDVINGCSNDDLSVGMFFFFSARS